MLSIRCCHLLILVVFCVGEKGYKIPRGGMFEYISGANFFGEILEWAGFALAAWSLPAFAFALFTFWYHKLPWTSSPQQHLTCNSYFFFPLFFLSATLAQEELSTTNGTWRSSRGNIPRIAKVWFHSSGDYLPLEPWQGEKKQLLFPTHMS